MDLTSETTLPVIDLKKAKTNKLHYAKKIVHELENEGFLYIDGVDVDFSKLYEACEWLFGLSQDSKYQISRRPYNPHSKNYYRGFWPVLAGEASRKEAYETCPDFDRKSDPRITDDNWMYEHALWPVEDGTFPFKKFLLNYYEKLHKTGLEIMRLVSIGLGIDENAFDEMFARMPLSTVRLIHYHTWANTSQKPPTNAYSEDGRLITTPDHADTAFLTLLHTFQFDGLEMLDKDGKWKPIPSRPNGLIMNIGDTFSRMMNGRFKSTRHRVIDINEDRYSVPFFFEPSFYSDVGVNWISKWTDGSSHVEEPYGPWMINVIKEVKKFAEARHLPDFNYDLGKGVIGFRHDSQPPMPPSGSWVYSK